MDRLEQIAMALHDGWWDDKQASGWKLGPRSTIRKTHPHMVPWSQLAESDKNQDRFIAAAILYRWRKTGKEANPRLIHDLWRWWELACGHPSHPHDRPYSDVHRHDSGEHGLQAGRVNHLLKSFLK